MFFIATILFGGTATSVSKMILLALIIICSLLIAVVLIEWLKKKPWKGRRTMRASLDAWKVALTETSLKLLAISETESSIRPSPEKWSKKEILGHLIDSAANNHQRFVRAQLSGEVKLPAYDQRAWVQTEKYQEEPWEELVALWKQYNSFLLHLAEKVPAEKLKNFCFIGEQEPVTLEFLITDYVSHLQHHLDQILE